MSLTDLINEGIKNAMKERDEARKRTLRAIKAQLLLLKTSGSGEEISEELEMKMLQKMIKERQDSYTIYIQQNREDLAKPEKEEIEIIQEFLPKQLSEAELELVIKEIIAKLEATSMKDMGKVMTAATEQLSGKADGKMVSILVKKLLA